MGKYDDKILKKKEKKAKQYRPTEFEKLQRTFREIRDDNTKLSKEDINKMVKTLKIAEKKGLIRGLYVKETMNYLEITWDDDSLGSPIVIKKRDHSTILSGES